MSLDNGVFLVLVFVIVIFLDFFFSKFVFFDYEFVGDRIFLVRSRFSRFLRMIRRREVVCCSDKFVLYINVF